MPSTTKTLTGKSWQSQAARRSFYCQRAMVEGGSFFLLFLSVVLGSISCILALVGTLFFSWIPTLISNGQWWYIIGGLTGVCLVVAAIGSMLGSSEAAWQDLNK